MEPSSQPKPRKDPRPGRSWRLFGIRGRLLILVLAAMVPLLILGVLNLRQELVAARALELERTRGQARVMALLVDGQLHAINTFLSGLTAVISSKPEDLSRNETLLLGVQGNL